TVGHAAERRFVRVTLEVGDEVGVGEDPHAGSHGIVAGCLREHERHGHDDVHPLRYNFLGSNTSRSTRNSVSVGGISAPVRARRASGHPTPACTSSAVTAG